MAPLTLITAALSARYRFEEVSGSTDATRVGITLRPNKLLLKPVPWE
jgi:epi-isozizaene 5-monooxygenase